MARPTAVGLPPAPLLGDHTGYLLHRAGFLVIRAVEQALEPLGLTGRTFFALTALRTLSPLSQQELSQLFALDPATVVAMVDQFEATGLVERQRSTADRRRYDLVLTPAGAKLVAKATDIVTGVEERFLAPLAARQRATLHKTLMVILRDDEHA
jgi:DNA-binding MarR family transcriptional regulator